MPLVLSRKRRKTKDGQKRKDGQKSKEKEKRSKKRKVDGNYKIKLRSVKKRAADGGQKKWTVYSLRGCPYCTMAVDDLKKMNQPCEYIEYAKLSPQQKEAVVEKINAAGKDGFSTYPRIVDPEGKFIGGYKDMLDKLTHLKNSQ